MNMHNHEIALAKVIKFPDDRERNPDDYAKKCPNCGGITFVITLANRVRCFECEVFFRQSDPHQSA